MTAATRTAIVFGKGPVAIRAAELLLDRGDQLEFVVPSTHELAGAPTLREWALGRGIAVRDVDRLDDLELGHIDLGISAFYDRIFRARHIERFGLFVNVHNSLLPRYRGVRPINWALKNGETRHGVTLHLITPGIDEGAVLAQEEYPIDPGLDEVRDVYARAIDAAISLIERELPRIETLRAVPQDEREATYYSAADDDALGERRFWTRDAVAFE